MEFTVDKVLAIFLLIVLISIYYHYRLFEHFVDAATTKAALTERESTRQQQDAANPETESSSKPLDTTDKKPLSVNDPGLFDASTLDKATQNYIQKQVASIVPAMMEPFDQIPTTYSKW